MLSSELREIPRELIPEGVIACEGWRASKRAHPTIAIAQDDGHIVIVITKAVTLVTMDERVFLELYVHGFKRLRDAGLYTALLLSPCGFLGAAMKPPHP